MQPPKQKEFIKKSITLFYPDSQEETFTIGKEDVKEILINHAPAFTQIEIQFTNGESQIFCQFPFRLNGTLKDPSPIILPNENPLKS